ncbi:MAG TPA: SDR family oxidoreductase [Herpetosiphonaceae bacterium]
MRIVVTGSTKGLGLALAREFLAAGDDLLVTSRSPEHVAAAVAALRREFPGRTIEGQPCDVADPAAVERLAAAAAERLGGVDIWVNNAGVTSAKTANLTESDPAELAKIIDTNLLGTMLCCRAALLLMGKQRRGQIFNMDGYGANGMASPGFAAYGATKRAIPQLSKTLAREAKGSGVGVHTLSPGMVLTDLLLGDASPRSKQVFNLLAEQPSTVARFLAPRIRAATGSGRYIKFLTTPGIAWRFATFWRRRGRFFDTQGRWVAAPETNPAAENPA